MDGRAEKRKGELGLSPRSQREDARADELRV